MFRLSRSAVRPFRSLWRIRLRVCVDRGPTRERKQEWDVRESSNGGGGIANSSTSDVLCLSYMRPLPS